MIKMEKTGKQKPHKQFFLSSLAAAAGFLSNSLLFSFSPNKLRLFSGFCVFYLLIYSIVCTSVHSSCFYLFNAFLISFPFHLSISLSLFAEFGSTLYFRIYAYAYTTRAHTDRRLCERAHSFLRSTGFNVYFEEKRKWKTKKNHFFFIFLFAFRILKIKWQNRNWTVFYVYSSTIAFVDPVDRVRMNRSQSYPGQIQITNEKIWSEKKGKKKENRTNDTDDLLSIYGLKWDKILLFFDSGQGRKNYFVWKKYLFALHTPHFKALHKISPIEHIICILFSVQCSVFGCYIRYS